MVELDDVGDLLEPLLEVGDLRVSALVSFSLLSPQHIRTHLLKVVAQLDDRRRLEHALLIDDELPVLKRVDVGHDEEQIGAALDGQEARPRHVDAVRVLEVLDGGTGRGLELQDGLPVIGDLRVDDDVELHALGTHDALEGLQVDPQVVRVEDLELANWGTGEFECVLESSEAYQT